MSESASPPVIDWLPSGWTADKLKTATLQDFEALSPEELAKLGEAQKRHTQALKDYDDNRADTANVEVPSAAQRSAIFGPASDTNPTATKRALDQTENSSSPGDGAEPAAKKQHPASIQRHVEVLQRNGYESWGFVIIRADYSDDEKWTNFKTHWNAAMQTMLDDPESGIAQDQKDAFCSRFAEDQTRYGDGFLANNESYAAEAERLRTDDVLVDGLDIGMVLVVDLEAMQSVAENGQSSLDEGQDDADGGDDDSDGSGHPAWWVWAIATDFEPEDEGHEGDGDDDDDDDDEEYNGRFKVAVSGILEEFWAILAAETLHASEMWPLAEPIYHGI